MGMPACLNTAGWMEHAYSCIRQPPNAAKHISRRPVQFTSFKERQKALQCSSSSAPNAAL